MLPKAKEPFRFYSRLGLTVMTGTKAKDLRELLENLKTVPESVIYEHTHRFLQQHQYLVPEPYNDFAYWVTHLLQDEKLGERLSAIDTVRFNSLKDLRQAFVSVISNHLDKNSSLRQAPEGKEFHFMGAIRFSMPTQHQARDLAEFLDCLKKVSISSLYLHIFEARLSPPPGRNDFSCWFETALDEKALAKKMESLNPYSHTLEGLRSKMIGLIEERLKELSYAAS